MYRCNNCNHLFDEPKQVRTSYEDYYGVGCEFSSKTRLVFDVCPKCDDEDIEYTDDDCYLDDYMY